MRYVLCIVLLLTTPALVPASAAEYFTSYKDIPGITPEETAAVEAMRREGGTFLFGTMQSTELFANAEGELRGVGVLFCEWLTQLFGIPFATRLYEWDDMISGLESGEIDFTGELTATPERRQTYLMTDAVAERLVKYFRLERGDASMVSELIRNPEREDRFLWPETSLVTDYYALLSKTDLPDSNINEVLYMKVGLVEGYAHTEIFHGWFPNHSDTVIYDSFDEAFDGLGRGEVDLVMGSRNQLLLQTNFRELPGYKANIVFDYPFASAVGYNKYAAVLRGLMDKAMRLIPTREIAAGWMRKTYDYRAKVAQSRLPWLIGAVLSAQLHDVGKIAIADSILGKPGALTKEEFEEMKRHTTVGGEIIEKIQTKTSGQDFLEHARVFAKYHHERWDGSGYPSGLRGEDIPLPARLMAIIDVYDALVSDRPYKKAFPHEEAMRIIAEGGGTHFDPVLAELFLRSFSVPS